MKIEGIGMKLFLHYIRQKRRAFLAAVVGGLIFLLVFLLYHLPVIALLYPTLLCGLLGVAFLVTDYLQMRRTYRQLNTIHSVTEVTAEELPPAKGAVEEAYLQLLCRFCEEHNAYCADTERKYTEMMDYYTVWAHQIKTPIASMRLNLQNEDSAMARKLSADLFRVEQYVEMVLTFLRLGAESTDYVFRECDLDKMIRQTVKRFAGEFINRRLTLVYEPCAVAVVTDEKWLSFVLEQVLSNALKYTSEGSITIALEHEKKLCIKDTGIGIAPEELPRIFENGFTGGNGRTDRRASGIGLYLCKRICTNLGHGIAVESEVGKGTVVTIDLAKKKLEVE